MAASELNRVNDTYLIYELPLFFFFFFSFFVFLEKKRETIAYKNFRYNNGTLVTTPDPMLGAHAIGMLTYSASGYMAMTSMASEPELRPASLTYPAQDNQTDAEWAMVGRHTFSYAGPVTIMREDTPETGSLMHGPLIVADVPSMVSTNQSRSYEMLEGGMMLRLSVTRERGVVHLLWQRLE
jgi:hypothetical protein